jgi:hypothetical protein
MTVNRRTRLGILAAALAALPLEARTARAHDDLEPAIQSLDGLRHERPFQPWQVSAGVRSALFHSTGYDPFSSNDAFTQFSATATWAFRTAPRLATAVGASIDAGSADGEARGASTSLSLTRVALVVEERFAPRPWAYAFLRVAPCWLRGTATLDDPSLTAPLETTFSTFGVDGSLGAAARTTPRGSRVGFWIVGDAGYGWAPAQHFALSPALPASDRDKAGATSLADFAPRGAFFRLGLALGF